jgi:hypothetical protein
MLLMNIAVRFRFWILLLVGASAALCQASAAALEPPADPGPVYGAHLEGFDYSWPVAIYRFQSQGQMLEMAYLDVMPPLEMDVLPSCCTARTSAPPPGKAPLRRS